MTWMTYTPGANYSGNIAANRVYQSVIQLLPDQHQLAVLRMTKNHAWNPAEILAFRALISKARPIMNRGIPVLIRRMVQLMENVASSQHFCYLGALQH